jgi:hypothetical protein
MELGAPRIVEQCDVLCGTILLHLRILFDGEQHLYDLHKMELASWRIVVHSVPGLQLSLEQARALVQEQAQIACGVAQLTFKWQQPRRAPAPGRAS